jgi:hypothetical protein
MDEPAAQNHAAPVARPKTGGPPAFLRRFCLPVAGVLLGALGVVGVGLPLTAQAQEAPPAPSAQVSPAPTDPNRPSLKDMFVPLVTAPPPVGIGPFRESVEPRVQLRAELGDVTSGLAGYALRPVADKGYELVDMIPAVIRRPFDRAFGILLDNAVSAPSYLLSAHLPFATGTLPSSAAIDIAAMPQTFNGCGPTMLAATLKGLGVPIATGEIDTQTPFFEGGSLLMDEAVRRQGFSLISGRGNMNDLRTYIAAGYPVMAAVGWPDGNGHYATVISYDDKTNKLVIDNWNGDGKRDTVSYGDFMTAWKRRSQAIMVVDPVRDERLRELRASGLLSREAKVQPGLSLSDLWITASGDFLVEGAYRKTWAHDDLTMRVNFSSNSFQKEAVGEVLSYTHRFSEHDAVNLYLDHRPALGTVGTASTTAVYLGIQHGGLEARVGGEQGGFQAETRFAKKIDKNWEINADARVSVAQGQGTRAFFTIGVRY